MAQDINSVVLTGRVVEDVLVRQTNSGQSVATIRLANNRPKKRQGDEWVDQPANFLNVVLWGRQAEALQQYLVKGKQIAVQGRLQQRSYQPQNEERKRSVVEIVADNVQLLGGSGGRTGMRSEADMEQAPRPAANNSPKGDNVFDDGPDDFGPEPSDDIPF